VVAGYHAEAIDVQGATVRVNEDWREGGELRSLLCALDEIGEDTVIIYGDLLFRSYMLHNLLDWDAEVLVAVDSAPLDGARGNLNDLAYCSAVDNRALYQQKVALEQVTSEPQWQGRQPDGRWIGMLRVAGAGSERLKGTLQALSERDDFDTLGLPDLINQVIADGHPPQVQYVSGHWLDINNLGDLERAGEFEHDREG